MRQLFNWRFVAAVGAMALLALLVRAVFVEDDSIATVIEATVVERQIDLIEPVVAVTQADEFEVGRNRVTSGFLDLTLDTGRVVRVAPGTLGEISCTDLDTENSCVLLADMLGDAVIWFALLPQAPRATVELPPIVDLQDGQAVFDNGWLIPYAPVIERDCGDEDLPTFGDFLRRFGPDSTSVVDLETGVVTTVRCGDPVED
ncbi:MAG: hypothetical protein WBP59_04055 [Ilumatobacteraceae bacterium]